MLVQDIEVTFSNHGLNQRVLSCDYVVFSLELLDEVLELLDFELLEDFDTATGEIRAREVIELQVKLNLYEGEWMAAWLRTPNKTMLIDEHLYEVVNDGRKIDFPLFKKAMIGTHPKLRFRAKKLGIANREYHVGSMLEGIVE